jgi:hypothetical protein
MKAPLVLFAVLVFGGLAFAGERQSAEVASEETPDVSPDRPDFTNGTGIVPLGHVQVEGGMTLTRSGSEREVSVGEVLVRIPFATHAEVRVGIPSYLATRGGAGERVTGADDLFLETKVRLVEGERTALAVMLNASLPTGSRAVAELRFQPSATLAMDLALADTVGLGLNLGATRASADGQRFTQVCASSSFGFDVSSRVGAFGEVYALNRTEPRGRVQRFADAGLSYRVTRRTVVDVRIGTGLGNGVHGPDYFVGFGLTRLF